MLTKTTPLLETAFRRSAELHDTIDISVASEVNEVSGACLLSLKARVGCIPFESEKEMTEYALESLKLLVDGALDVVRYQKRKEVACLRT